jgi:hypothetical protein
LVSARGKEIFEIPDFFRLSLKIPEARRSFNLEPLNDAKETVLRHLPIA